MRRTGLLTTNAELVVRSWDNVLESMTGIAAAAAIGRPLADLAPEASDRGTVAMLADTVRSGTVTVLAPAIHHYLIACSPAEPSPEFTHMQQRVVATPLSNDDGIVGLAVSIEDVTARLDAERALARALRDPDPAVRRAAVERASSNGISGIEPIGPAMRDDNWQVRRAAVDVLASRPDRELLHAIVSALRDGHHDFSLLSSAIKLLSLTGMDAADALIELLQSDDADLRIQSALALGTQTGGKVVDALLAALDDADRNVRFHAIESLGKLRAHAAVEALGALVDSADFFLAFPAIESLVRIGDPNAAGRIVPRLSDPALRDAAAEALGVLGDEDVLGALLAALEGANPPVGAIVTALAAIHARYEETSGAGGRIEDLTRRMMTPAAAAAVLQFVRVATGAELRAALLVLSWVRTPAVAAELSRLLAHSAVPHEVIETLVRFGSPILDVLGRQLTSGEIESRRAAAVALGRIGDRAAVPALIAELEEGELQLLAPVAGALGRLGDQRAFEPLLARLGHPDPGVRQAIIGALNSIGHPDMASRIRTLLTDDNPNVRQSAAKIAGYFGYPDCAEALLARAADADERVRAAALEHVAYLEHPGVVPLLIKAGQDDTPRGRAAAAAALGHVSDSRACDVLLQMLHDEDSWVRYFAALSLGRQRDSRAVDALGGLAADDVAAHVRIAAIDAIGAIGGIRALSVLEPMSASPDSDVASAALRAIGEIRLPAVGGILKEAVRSDESSRRAAAAQGLAARGGRESIETLRWIALADRDQSVVSSALAGLSGLASGHGDTVDDAVLALAAIAADPARRAAALPVLARIPSTAIQSLGGPLRHAEASIRLVAVDVLGRIARPPASSLLIQALDDPDPCVRGRAVQALSRLGARGVARRFAGLARSDESEDVRRLAQVALARAGGADAESTS